jgi:hypothetical protein
MRDYPLFDSSVSENCDRIFGNLELFQPKTPSPKNQSFGSFSQDEESKGQCAPVIRRSRYIPKGSRGLTKNKSASSLAATSADQTGSLLNENLRSFSMNDSFNRILETIQEELEVDTYGKLSSIHDSAG